MQYAGRCGIERRSSICGVSLSMRRTLYRIEQARSCSVHFTPGKAPLAHQGHTRDASACVVGYARTSAYVGHQTGGALNANH